MSHFSFLFDGSIIGVYLISCMVAGIAVRRYIGKVEDFLIAGREMNLYLGIASLAAAEFGIVTCMYTAQQGYDLGFAGAAPGILEAAAAAFVGFTGFCIKPLRSAGVMTLPELFDKKFGKKIRWASGVVIVLGGLLNMGVFLRTAGDFLVAVVGLNPKYLEITMTLLLLSVAIYTILGGMLSVLITDYMQFIVMSAGLIIVTIMILFKIGWSTLVNTVSTHYGASGFNPFINPKMGWSYMIFNALLGLSMFLTWSTIIARVLSATDYKVGKKIYTRTSFFFVCRFVIPGIWGIAALATLAPGVVGKNTLMAMPIFLSTFIPVGVMGLVIAAMLAAEMSTDSSYMLTWGSVIYNDILAPFRKTKWTEKRGILWNRMIVALIGIFLLVYGLWYPLRGNLWNYITITGTIYLSSMSTLLVACCYWKKANNWGAAGAIILGAVMPVAYLIFEQIPRTREIFVEPFGPSASCIWGIFAYAGAAAAMVVGSLLKYKFKKVQ